MVIAASGIEFHHSSGVGDSFDAGKREHDPDEPGPVLTKGSVQRLQMSDRFAHVWQTEKSEHDDNDCSRYRNQERESAGLFWSEQIKQTNY